MDFNNNNYASVEQLITNFCQIVLVKGDTLSEDKAAEFIDNLTDEDRTILNLEEPHKNYYIRTILQKKINDYLEQYDDFSVNKPFEFNHGGSLDLFKQHCCKHYRDKNQNASLPSVIDFTLKYIQEVSEHYSIFQCFYDARSKETSNKILQNMSTEAKKQAEMVVNDVAEVQARLTVKNEVNEKMKEVTKNISETSVTILGMFTGIVLTVVAGLFYSSSVIDNINSADFCKLISISSLIGFVCLNLLAVMFRFVERIRNPKKTDMPRFSRLTLFVSISLLVVMIVFAILHFRGVEDNNVSQEETNSDFAVSAEMQFTVDSEAEKTPLEDLPQSSDISYEE